MSKTKYLKSRKQKRTKRKTLKKIGGQGGQGASVLKRIGNRLKYEGRRLITAKPSRQNGRAGNEGAQQRISAYYKLLKDRLTDLENSSSADVLEAYKFLQKNGDKKMEEMLTNINNLDLFKSYLNKRSLPVKGDIFIIENIATLKGIQTAVKREKELNALKQANTLGQATTPGQANNSGPASNLANTLGQATTPGPANTSGPANNLETTLEK